MANIVYIKIALIIFLTISVLCLIAAHAERFRELTMQFFNIFYSPFFRISSWCRETFLAVLSWVKSQINIEGQSNNSHHAIYYLAGCLIYSCFTGLFLYCDIGLLIQLVEAAFGLTSPVQIVEPAIVIAASMMASSIAWGVIFFDAIEMTHLAPCFDQLSSIRKRILIFCSAIFFTISLIGILSLIYFQSWVTTDSMYSNTNAASESVTADINLSEVDNLENLMNQLDQTENENTIGGLPPKWIIPVSRLSSGFSILVCTAFCFAAAIPLIKWVILCVSIVLILPILILLAVSNLIAMIINALSGFVSNFLDLLIDIGNSILERFPRSKANRVNTQENGASNHSNNREDSISEKEKKSSENSSSDEEPNEASINGVNSSQMGFDPFG